MQRHDGMQIGQVVRKDRFDTLEQTFEVDRGPQYCGLHDSQKQCGYQLQGHEPYQFLWNHSWIAIFLVCRSVFWLGDGSPDFGLEPVGRDGRTASNA